jgi:hypothetical protein
MTATQRLILASFKSAAMAGGSGMSAGGSPGGSPGEVAAGMTAGVGGGGALSPFMGGGRFDGRGTMAGLAHAKRMSPTYAGAPSVQNVGGKLYG